MSVKIGPEFHSLEEEDLKTDVYKKRTKYPVWKDKIRIPMHIKIGSEFHCLQKQHWNSVKLDRKLICYNSRT